MVCKYGTWISITQVLHVFNESVKPNWQDIDFFFQKSALARFDHLFLKKTYDQPNFKNFPEISNICIDSGDRFVFKTW